MKFSSVQVQARSFAAAAWCACALIVFSAAAAARPLDETPIQKTITVGTRTVRLSLARPANPGTTIPPFMVVFASGDGGLRGMSKEVLMHLAGQSYWVVGFSSPEAFKGIGDDSKAQPNYAGARDRLASIIGAGEAGDGTARADAGVDHRDVARRQCRRRGCR